MSVTSFFWLIPLLPLGVFALLSTGLTRFGRFAAGLAVVAMAGSFILAAFSLVAVVQGAHARVSLLWMTVGGRQLTLALWLDPLSTLVALLVATVGLIIFVYAVSYMAEDLRRGRFFAIFSLFAGSMLTLVLAADLITLFIAWELVGLCSYLLIGFWFERPAAPPAASKAFFVTRLADLCLLAGILLLIGVVGNGRIDAILGTVTDYTGVNQGISHGLIGNQGAIHIVPTAVVLLLIGAAGKSAQVPFQGWLPDAMAGPTPVSALLHSATMVVAGVFLVARLYPLFLAVPTVLHLIAWVGVLTAVLGSAAALVEADLKRMLAYSTMSQIGLMFVGLGSGSLAAGVLLLVAQALYKATLFLAAGAIDHAVEGTAFERMGGLLRRMPLTAIAFALSAAALAGLPVTLALPPKDPVLAAAWQSNMLVFWLALLASLLTAFYSTRAFGNVFLGVPSEAATKARVVKRGLLVPLLALAVLIPFGLLANAALLGHPLDALLGVAAPDVPLATTLTVTGALIGVAVGLWARFLWPHTIIWPVLQGIAPLFTAEFGLKPLYRLVTRAGFALVFALGAFDRRVFDTLIGGIVATLRGSTRLLSGFDRRVFDAFASTLATLTLVLVGASGRFDVRRIDGVVQAFGREVLALGQRVRVVQTGRIENYLLIVFVWGIGVIALAVVALMIR